MPLPPGEIHVWFHSADVSPAVRDDLTRVLTSAELAKATRYRFEADRARSIVARSALRIHLSRYTGVDANSILISAPEGTKPAAPLTDIQFNVSHAGDLVALVFASGIPVGIDVERIRPVRDARGIARRYFSPDEQRELERSGDPEDTFFRIWTAKEALVKGTGKGLTSDLTAFTVPWNETTLSRVRMHVSGYDAWCVAALPAPRHGYRAALAARTSDAAIRVTTGAVPPRPS
jgi:4'-phosphopantetheinyl transferase